MAQHDSTTATSADHASPLAAGTDTRFPFQAVAANTGRTALVGFVSGAIAGLIAGGIGSRLAMRLVAVAGGPDIQGVETESEALVGEITTGGTTGLIVFGMIVGAVGGLMYVAARNWLPRNLRLRTPLYGAFMMFIAAVFVLDKDNSDFAKVGHPVLSVVLFAAIPFVYGLIQVPVAEWLSRSLPAVRPARASTRLYAVVSLVVLVPLLPVIAGSLSPNDGPMLLLILVPLALVYALIFLRTNGERLGRVYAGPVPASVRFGGYAALAVAAGFGAYQFVDSVISIVA